MLQSRQRIEIGARGKYSLIGVKKRRKVGPRADNLSFVEFETDPAFVAYRHCTARAMDCPGIPHAIGRICVLASHQFVRKVDRADTPEFSQYIDTLVQDADAQQSRGYSATFPTLLPPAIEYD